MRNPLTHSGPAGLAPLQGPQAGGGGVSLERGFMLAASPLVLLRMKVYFDFIDIISISLWFRLSANQRGLDTLTLKLFDIQVCLA